ncbi:methyltransferase [Amycolatopsis albispora]|uniref:Methyltransferase n=1 Tax=Amycolatopsis albispora TaxID=1804986 RepID=A0A344LJW6_9PSEU|nr:methyltransferase [Amycolatopsis albispora]
MPLVRLPGVYRPQADTHLLASVVARMPPPVGARVLDVCTGTGALALTAARLGGTEVTAVDISWRAVLSVWLNAFRHGLPVRARRQSFMDTDGRFDLVLANPPYVPAAAATADRAARAWDAGADGRTLLDPLCDLAPRLLAPSGCLLLVHSDVSGVDTTLDRLRAGGLRAEEVARRRNPFGPVMHARAAFLEDAGLIERGRRHEDLVVIRAER